MLFQDVVDVFRSTQAGGLNLISHSGANSITTGMIVKMWTASIMLSDQDGHGKHPK